MSTAQKFFFEFWFHENDLNGTPYDSQLVAYDRYEHEDLRSFVIFPEEGADDEDEQHEDVTE